MSDSTDEFDEIDHLDEEVSPAPHRGMSRVKMAFTRWWVILIFAVLGYVVSLYTLSIAEPMHSARAVLEVVTKKRKLVGSELERDKVGMQAAMMTMTNKIMGSAQLTKVVNSPKIQAIEKAVPPAFSMKPKYWREEEELSYKSAAEANTSEVVAMITRNLRVQPRAGTMLIDIKVSHMDSQTAITIADAIVEEFIKTERERKSGSTSEAFKILRKDASIASTELETHMNAMAAYGAVLATNSKLKGLQNSLLKLKLRYKSKHPKMIETVAMLNETKKRFRLEILAVTETSSELDFWSQYKIRVDELDKVIREGQGQEASEDQSKKAKEAEEAWFALMQGALAARTSALSAEVKRKQSHFDRVTQRITDIDVEEKNDQVELQVAERAFASGNVQIDKYKRLGQGLAGGAIVGFGIAYLLGMLDYKIYDVRTVEEATGTVCLAAFPESVSFDIEDEWESILIKEPNSPDAEAIRNLRASVMLLGKAERNKSILVTSAAPGEGKTTVASELAAAFALNDQKTIIVDLDLRKPRVHTLFPRINEKLGMTEVLAGQADLASVVQKTNLQGLHVICAGTKPPNPAELLQESELSDIITKLSEYYDRVIIDTPPLLPVSDSRLLAKHVQTVILCVRALKVPVGAIMRAKELLEQARVQISGVVINAMKRKHAGSNYYGYKGYGEYGGSGGYGGYYEDDDE